MGYIATAALRWGHGWLQPGERVPENDPGRNYALMLESGQIEEATDKPPARKPPAKAKGKAAAK